MGVRIKLRYLNEITLSMMMSCMSDLRGSKLK